MESFLYRVSADLYATYGSDISKLCLVFPGRRARLFFAESLSKRITQPLWQPEALSISDLIYRWAGRRPTDRLRLLAELFKVYGDIRGDMNQFDKFYHWGEMILHDFDQIDKYLVNAKALYQNLRDQKALEGDYSFLTPEQVEAIRMFWNSFQPEKTDLQQSFTQMWEIMYPLYIQFRCVLDEQGLAYEGMLYRHVVETGRAPSLQSYVFIGFNALNTCEHTIFRRLQVQGLARFYWDIDDYYIHDTRQEAGLFLRKNLHDFPPAETNTPCSHFSQPKEIETWAIPSDVLQTRIVPQIIQNNHLHTDKRTAIVLCDETLLIPLLSALPEVATDINVTMGYPLAKTSLFSFTEALLLFYRSARMRGSSWFYYHVEVSRLLNHPLISLLCPQAAEELKKKIIKENILFVPDNLFITDHWLQAMAACPSTPDDWLSFFSRLLDAIEETVLQSDTADSFLLPVLRLANIEVNKFRGALTSCGFSISMPLFFNLFRQTLKSISVPFSGEPLEGIQVMGILETRTLDFEHVVILSAQEGFLPSASEAPSFIPYNLKAGFGLPLREEHEAIYAYYFYRLLQRAQKVSLLYSTGGDTMQTGEQSRYLLQLMAESPHTINEKRLAMPVVLPPPAPSIIIEKKGVYQEKLMRYLNKDSNSLLTPSAINTYLQCPLQFYYRYIENIKEEQEVAEEADARGMGTILHGVMESLYRPFLEKTITTNNLQQLLEDKHIIRIVVEEAIQNHYAPQSTLVHLFEQGRWLILADVLTTYISQVIRFDMTRTPFTLKAVETGLKIALPVAPQFTVPLGGYLDRVQERDGTCYVVDYKTGKEQRSFESLEALFAPERRVQNSAVFQIFWYVMLYQEVAPSKKVIPLLYYIRSLFDPSASTLLYDKMNKQEIDDMTPYLETYRTLLGQKLTELFDLSHPFVQTNDMEHCTYCNYNRICQRN